MTPDIAEQPRTRACGRTNGAPAPPPSVSMRLARLTQDRLLAQGVPADETLRALGLSAAELACDDLRLGLAVHARLRPLLAQLGPDRRDAPPPDGAAWAPYWPEQAAVWLNQPTAVAAVASWLRYRPLIGTIDDVALDLARDRLTLAYRPHDVADDDGAIASALANFWMVGDILREHAQAHRLQLQIELARPLRPRQRMAWQHRLQVPVRAGCGGETHRLVVRGAGIHHPGAPYQALLARCGQVWVDGMLERLASQPVLDSLAQRVKVMIAQRWDRPGGAPDDDLTLLQRHVAEALGCSRWTLRRQLGALGTSFADLVEELRAQRLPALLARPEHSLLEVAGRLGFASASAFSHYGRRMLGTSPSSWRRANALRV